MDYLVFDDVLAFDATYRKIKYSTSLVIFSGVNHHNQSVIFVSAIVGDETEDAYGRKTPGVGYTDGDLEMRNAIIKKGFSGCSSSSLCMTSDTKCH
jgi:serine protease inhibitor ecotin